MSVPHDPNDLRWASEVVRIAEMPKVFADKFFEHGVYRTELADRLEAWADDIERDEATDPFGAGMEAGHKDLLVMNEERRQRARNVLADYFDGDFNFADHLIARLHHKGFEVVTTDVVYRAPKIDAERLAPLEAAVLDAAKAEACYSCNHVLCTAVRALREAVRALQEATDAD